MADIVIAGAGVAGLTAALALAAKGIPAIIFERTERLEEVGAGLQLSPNATRILHRLGVLDRLRRDAVQPAAILLKDAGSLRDLARVPLRQAAEKRWGAPYLVIHRADLQRALVECVRETPAIALETGVEIGGARFAPSGGVAVTLRGGGTERQIGCRLLVGADGVWSGLRSLAGGGRSRFTGRIAFRAVLDTASASASDGAILSREVVTAFLAPTFHLIAYPLRGGKEINLVAITGGPDLKRGWSSPVDVARLAAAMADAAPALSGLAASAGPWTTWPIHEVESAGGWTHPGGLVLIGDAAHAVPPYAAQGAAMAIEDAALLAQLAASSSNIASVLATFERLRRPRLARVARRGAFNRFVWHAGGPVALARDLALRLRSEASLAADFDWLYGYDAEAALSGRVS